MKTAHQLIHERLLAKAGLIDRPAALLSLSDLARTEWSQEFETLMRNRLIMGALRYGRIGTVSKRKYERAASISKRLCLYVNTGNTELLVDIANLALVEFVEGTHPLKHFHASDDGEHCQAQ